MPGRFQGPFPQPTSISTRGNDNNPIRAEPWNEDAKTGLVETGVRPNCGVPFHPGAQAVIFVGLLVLPGLEPPSPALAPEIVFTPH